MREATKILVFHLVWFLCIHVPPMFCANVTYDHRALLIDGKRRVFISGSIHYPRSTPQMWPDLIQKSKDGGLDVIETYVFWNFHEPVRGQYYFEGRGDLVNFVKLVAAAGLYVHLRIGPYACAEWNYGGFPLWLHFIPGIKFRTDNEPFKAEMQRFTAKIVDMMKQENLYASQGGPIILSQIENEYGNIDKPYGAAGKSYIKWAASMATSLNTGVPWVMCQQPDAPDPMINTCNGFYCDQFTPNANAKPKMWTENWSGWFLSFGGAVPYRPVEDIAFAVARFYQRGGTFQNYYMYHGGNLQRITPTQPEIKRLSFYLSFECPKMGSDSLPSTLTSTKPTPIPTNELDEEHDHDDSPSTAALLSFNTDSSSSSEPLSTSNNKPLFIVLILVTCISLSVASAFAYLFFSSRSPSSSSTTTASSATSSASASPSPSPTPLPSVSHARPLTKLNRPKVILISSDGFRFGYQFKTPTPNIARLIANGTEAETGLIPVFPSLTFPNHYSIATGLYPAYHGIVNNHFLDPHSGDAFYMGAIDPKWWLGEPLWETVVKNGLNAATYFWPGTQVHKGPWNCPLNFCRHYNSSVPFEDRVDAVLSYFDLPSDEIPDFMTLYFEDPDHQGHKVGADDPQITEAVSRIDRMIGRLIFGLEQRGIFDDVTIIMVGDHGMVTTCDKKLIFLDDLAPWINVPDNWVISHTPLLAIMPPSGYSPSDVVAKMNQGLSSGKVENGRYLKVYLKEDLPSRLHYSASDRIPPIIGLLEEGFKVKQKRSKNKECGGSHGYDNEFFSMRSIFIGHGPQFARGRKIPSFENVQIYNLVTFILNIKGAPNNGSASFAKDVLLSAA